jgi:hypothetical protein
MAESSPTQRPPSEPDLLTDDPFFKLTDDSNWNACIGKQGTEENYLDGYIEASMELVNAVIEKKMFEKRDTVVLPILYNARHAVELALKFTIDRLVEGGILLSAPTRHHNIQSYWRLLNDAIVGDEEFRGCVRALEPFIASLTRIDGDGQELRYHLNRDEGKSLSTYSLANLEVIRDSLGALSKIISALKYRTIDFLDERRTGAFTTRCSRRDLIAIAKLLPPIDKWREAIFDEKKEIVKSRFDLSNKQFSNALDVIKQNREMKALIGAESDLLHLSDDKIAWVIEQWRKVRPPREGDALHAFDYFGDRIFEEMKEHSHAQAEVIAALQKHLTKDEVAELETIFYLGRDGWFPEGYDKYVTGVKRKQAVEKDSREQIAHLMEKTNFLTAVTKALSRLGRVSLSSKLAVM